MNTDRYRRINSVKWIDVMCLIDRLQPPIDDCFDRWHPSGALVCSRSPLPFLKHKHFVKRIYWCDVFDWSIASAGCISIASSTRCCICPSWEVICPPWARCCRLYETCSPNGHKAVARRPMQTDQPKMGNALRTRLCSVCVDCMSFVTLILLIASTYDLPLHSVPT